MNMHYIVSHINKKATKPTLLKNKPKNNLAKKDFYKNKVTKKVENLHTPILQLGQFNGVNWIDELLQNFLDRIIATRIWFC